MNRAVNVATALVVAAAADVASTSLGLSIGLSEANPIGATILAAVDVPAPLLLALAKVPAIAVAMIPILIDGPLRIRLAGPTTVAGLWTFASVANTIAVAGVVA